MGRKEEACLFHVISQHWRLLGVAFGELYLESAVAFSSIQAEALLLNMAVVKI